MTELRGISKFFSSNGVSALEQADFTLMPGEIHALAGENGAGKSTLMHIMSGYLSQDAGLIIVDGKERRFKTPADALTAGIGMVRQHPRVVRGFKVWENCVLGAEKPKSAVAEVSGRWGFGLDLDSYSESLSVSGRQKAAILALLLRGARYLVFDEPAAVLSPGETETLFELLRRLKEAGRGIVLISHKLDETLTIADRITLIHRGKTLKSLEASALSAGELASLIFGENDIKEKNMPDPRPVAPLSAQSASESVSAARETSTESVLSVRSLSVGIAGMPVIRNISLELRRGKILGIAGIKDSGLETLELALAGFLGNAFSGTIRLNGSDVSGVRSFRENGGVYLGADRLGKNLAPSFPLRESLIIHAHRRSRYGLAGKFGLMDKTYLDAFCGRIMEKAGINRLPENRADSFSGGMLQRILLARELEENASLFVLAGGGWGLDRRNRKKFLEQLRALTLSGKSALLFSSDTDELIEAADEILVLRNGNFAARVSLSDGTESAAREIRGAMVGTYAGAAANTDVPQ